MTVLQFLMVFGAALSILLAGFQLLLAAGFPFGRLAWGGQHRKLPGNLKISSFVSSLLLIYAALILLGQGDAVAFINNSTIVRISLWAFVVIFGLSILGNVTSESRIEKKVMTPIAVYLFLVFLIAAI